MIRFPSSIAPIMMVALLLAALAPPGPGQSAKRQEFLFLLEARSTFFDDATEAEMQVMAEHFEYLKGQHREGRLLLAGRALDRPLAIYVVQASSRAEAEEIVNSDPAVKAGIMRWQAHPFHLVLERNTPAAWED